MRQYRVQVRQAHPVPTKVERPRGPFPAELYASAGIVTDYVPEEDHSGPGATAQNNFHPEPLMRCINCSMQVFESQTARHVCPPQETPS